MSTLNNTKAISLISSDVADYSKADLTKKALTEKIKTRWKDIKEEVTDKDERKAIGVAIYRELINKHKLAPQRASEILRGFGIQQKKSGEKGVEIAEALVLQVVELSQKLSPDHFTTLLSRAYGKGRKMTPEKPKAPVEEVKAPVAKAKKPVAKAKAKK